MVTLVLRFSAYLRLLHSVTSAFCAVAAFRQSVLVLKFDALKLPLIGCCACWVELPEPVTSLLAEPLPMVTPLEPLPLVEPEAPVLGLPVLGLAVLGLIVVLPDVLPLALPLPLVWAWAVEKASAVPAVSRATVRRRENIGFLHRAPPME